MTSLRRSTIWVIYIGGVAFSLLLTCACLSGRRGEPISGQLRDPAPEVARGQVAFMRHCHQCHPGGDAGLGPAVNNKPLPGFMIKLQVRKGLGAMPAFSEQQMSGSELNDTVAYLKALRRQKPEGLAHVSSE